MDHLPRRSPDGRFICPPSEQEQRERYLTQDTSDLIDLGKAGELTAFSDRQTLPHFLRKLLLRLQQTLCSAPAFVNALRSMLPEEALVAVLTDGQKAQLAERTVKLLTKKDGSILATLCDAKTGNFVANVPLQEMRLTPELVGAVAELSTQIQMVQVMERLDELQESLDRVLVGQQNDRLATADSCKQKYRQALMILDPDRRQDMLLHIVRDAEDSRNLLMRALKAGVSYMMEQPESMAGKILAGESDKKLDERMREIRSSFSEINQVSMVEALAYQHLSEPGAMLESLKYYGDFISDAFLKMPDTLSRLSSMDEKSDNYWEKTVPILRKNLVALQETLNMIKQPESYLELEG